MGAVNFPQSISGPRERWNKLTILFAFMVFVSWLVALFVIGPDIDQGDVFRIMFVHVPVAWCSFLWVILSAVFALLMFLRPLSSELFDRSSHAALELGTLFAGLALLTGMIWGRPTWGVWWDWDPRLTSTLVMFILCCGYHVLRSFTPDIKARRTVAGVTSLLSAINVPIVYFSVNLWRSLHQPQTFVKKNTNSSADIGWVLLLNLVCLCLFSLAMYKTRRQGIAAEEALQEAREAH